MDISNFIIALSVGRRIDSNAVLYISETHGHFNTPIRGFEKYDDKMTRIQTKTYWNKFSEEMNTVLHWSLFFVIWI